MMTRIIKSIVISLLLMGTISCGGDGGSVGVSSEPLLEGHFVDAPVKGLSYESPSYSGVTGEEGSFYYKKGDVITFKIGQIILGSSIAKSIMTPLDLVPNGATNNTAVINISRLLQSLDSILGDNKINIPQGVLQNAIKNGIESLTAGLDFSDPVSFDTLIDSLIAFLAAGVTEYAENPPSVINAATAKAHLEATLSQIIDESNYSPYSSIVITPESLKLLSTYPDGGAIDAVSSGSYIYYIGDSFGIIDFSDPTNPQTLSTLDVGSVYGVTFDGRYAYVETDGNGPGIFSNGTVAVIDCIDPYNPVAVADNSEGYYSAYGFELKGNYLYNLSDRIIGIYDISDPLNMRHVQNRAANFAWFGKIVDDRLYVGDGYVNQFEIFDISDPEGEIWSYQIYDQRFRGDGITAKDQFAFIAGSSQIYAVDVSIPEQANVVGEVNTGALVGYEMRTLGNYLLAVGRNAFVVIDINDPTSMELVGKIDLTNGRGWGFTVIDRYAFVADGVDFKIVQLFE